MTERETTLHSYLSATLSKVTELEDFACTAHHGDHLKVRENIAFLEVELRQVRDALRQALKEDQ